MTGALLKGCVLHRRTPSSSVRPKPGMHAALETTPRCCRLDGHTERPCRRNNHREDLKALCRGPRCNAIGAFGKTEEQRRGLEQSKAKQSNVGSSCPPGSQRAVTLLSVTLQPKSTPISNHNLHRHGSQRFAMACSCLGADGGLQRCRSKGSCSLVRNPDRLDRGYDLCCCIRKSIST